MRNLSGWICLLREGPGVEIKVNWHEGKNCGCSIMVPKEKLGEHVVIDEDALVPKERMRKVRAKGELDLSSASVEELKDKLEALRTMRTVAASKPRKKVKADSVSKGGILGLIGKLSPEGLVALEQALTEGKTDEEIMEIVKAGLA